MVKVDHLVVNMFFLPGASAPPKHSAASPLTAAVTGCILRLRIGTQQVWHCIGRLAGLCCCLAGWAVTWDWETNREKLIRFDEPVVEADQ